MRHETPFQKAKRINEERRKKRDERVSTKTAQSTYDQTMQMATWTAIHSSSHDTSSSSWDSGGSSDYSGGSSDW